MLGEKDRGTRTDEQLLALSGQHPSLQPPALSAVLAPPAAPTIGSTSPRLPHVSLSPVVVLPAAPSPSALDPQPPQPGAALFPPRVPTAASLASGAAQAPHQAGSFAEFDGGDSSLDEFDRPRGARGKARRTCVVDCEAEVDDLGSGTDEADADLPLPTGLTEGAQCSAGLPDSIAGLPSLRSDLLLVLDPRAETAMPPHEADGEPGRGERGGPDHVDQARGSVRGRRCSRAPRAFKLHAARETVLCDASPSSAASPPLGSGAAALLSVPSASLVFTVPASATDLRRDSCMFTGMLSTDGSCSEWLQRHSQHHWAQSRRKAVSADLQGQACGRDLCLTEQPPAQTTVRCTPNTRHMGQAADDLMHDDAMAGSRHPSYSTVAVPAAAARPHADSYHSTSADTGIESVALGMPALACSGGVVRGAPRHLAISGGGRLNLHAGLPTSLVPDSLPDSGPIPHSLPATVSCMPGQLADRRASRTGRASAAHSSATALVQELGGWVAAELGLETSQRPGELTELRQLYFSQLVKASVARAAACGLADPPSAQRLFLGLLWLSSTHNAAVGGKYTDTAAFCDSHCGRKHAPLARSPLLPQLGAGDHEVELGPGGASVCAASSDQAPLDTAIRLCAAECTES